MVTVGMYYDVLPGQGPAFQAKFEAVVEALRGAKGHGSSFLYQRVDDRDSYAIISEWDDTQAFHDFIRSDAFREVTAWGRATALRNPPRHKIYPRSEDIGRPS
jgi:heme-degrading monooxygenase HmoA